MLVDGVRVTDADVIIATAALVTAASDTAGDHGPGRHGHQHIDGPEGLVSEAANKTRIAKWTARLAITPTLAAALPVMPPKTASCCTAFLLPSRRRA